MEKTTNRDLKLISIEEQLNNLSAKITVLERQQTCGFRKGHESIVITPWGGCGGGGEWWEYADREECSICGKLLNVFDTIIDAEERKAEILQEKADRAKHEVEKLKTNTNLALKEK